LKTAAASVVARVIYGTRVTIVTRSRVGLGSAPTKSIAEVIRARVAIIANNGESNADSCITMVARGTRIAILALTFRQLFVLAAGLSLTGVGATFIAIVTEVHKVSAHLLRFVNQTITIIVFSVAGFGHRICGITFTKPTLTAYSLALASTRFTNV